MLDGDASVKEAAGGALPMTSSNRHEDGLKWNCGSARKVSMNVDVCASVVMTATNAMGLQGCLAMFW